MRNPAGKQRRNAGRGKLVRVELMVAVADRGHFVRLSVGLPGRSRSTFRIYAVTAWMARGEL